MLSKGAKRIDLRRYHMISEFFLLMTIARSDHINKDDTSILNLFKKLLASANTSVQF